MTDSSPPTKRRKMDFSEAILVKAGQEQKNYILHQSLVKSSDFLSKAVSGDWKEARDGTITAPDIEPKHFDYYARWLYSGKISLESGDSSAKDNSDDYILMMDLYLLGYFLLDMTFRNCIIDTLLKIGDRDNTYPDKRSINRIWDKTPENAPIKDLMINHWASAVDTSDILEAIHDLPQRFVKRLLLRFLAVRDEVHEFELLRPRYNDRHDYHEHDKTTPKCS